VPRTPTYSENASSATNDARVYLVGAGPGDLGLLSLRAAELIAHADIILYDALVGPEIVSLFPESATTVFVGKKSGKHSVIQQEINHLLIEACKNHNCIVRLKGGDPLIFGRGGEEMEALSEAGIAFEVVPGVTSAFAAGSFAGIPLTHRDLSRSIALCTGHLKAGVDPSQICIPVADTVAFLMGIKNLPTLVEKILSQGKFTPETPVAIIENATLSNQRIFYTTLAQAVAVRDSNSIVPPSLIIVGNVASIGKKLAWQPAVRRIFLLRSSEQNKQVQQRFFRPWVRFISTPLLRFDHTPEALQLHELAEATDIIFSSTAAVEAFFHALSLQGKDARVLSGKKIGVIGAQTRATLQSVNILADYMPRQFSARGLLQELGEDLRGRCFYLPQSNKSPDTLADQLRARNATVYRSRLYRTVLVRNESLVHKLSASDLVFFTSPSTVEAFFTHFTSKTLPPITAVSIGHSTTRALQQRYQGPIIQPPDQSSIKAMMQCVEQLCHPARTHQG